MGTMHLAPGRAQGRRPGPGAAQSSAEGFTLERAKAFLYLF